MSVPEPQSVDRYRTLIIPYLESLKRSHKEVGIKLPLTEVDCGELLNEIRVRNEGEQAKDSQQAGFAAIETVFREQFYELIASIDINDAKFSQVWILLDVVAILSDKELCESGLIFWLIEELLDSQTIDGCRKVFDYLESRRERVTKKHFKQKQLIILRCCNELLRRLSRAEDIVFCGRVFIFLFQSFPLGDKSSVNLRGEYHVENITTYDPAPIKSKDAIKPMELDSKLDHGNETSNVATPGSSFPDDGSTTKTANPSQISLNGHEVQTEADLDALYPSFWDLQAFFSAPTLLFETQNLKSFKEGIALTMNCFEKMSNNSSSSNRQDESGRGTKRKRSETGAEVASTFNPKYLTNRDLFDLELHDISFRRHILVQMLILLDFLLSLTPTAKAKLADLTNKSVLYTYTLADEDAEWANTTRGSIASYLQQGSSNEGKFYYRMVDTVLSRDKNWVRWKAENCPPIDRSSIDVQQHIEAQKNLQKISSKRTLPPPPGARDLDFLSKSTPIDSLKEPSRYELPSMESFYKGIQNDELDAEMGTEEEMQIARDAKERKFWQALRASKNRFNLCERIENGKNMKALVGETESTESKAPVNSKEAEEPMNEATEPMNQAAEPMNED